MTEEAAEDVERVLQVLSFIVYLLYWYTSTNTDAAEDMERVLQVLSLLALQVQKYLLYWYKSGESCRGCGAFAAGTSIYLLYWYTSTNTDAAGACCSCRANQLLSLLAVLVHKYKY